MLVLTAAVHEVIHIDGPAELVLLGVRGKRVRWGIKADREVNVVRANAKLKQPRQPVQTVQPSHECQRASNRTTIF